MSAFAANNTAPMYAHLRAHTPQKSIMPRHNLLFPLPSIPATPLAPPFHQHPASPPWHFPTPAASQATQNTQHHITRRHHMRTAQQTLCQGWTHNTSTTALRLGEAMHQQQNAFCLVNSCTEAHKPAHNSCADHSGMQGARTCCCRCCCRTGHMCEHMCAKKAAPAAPTAPRHGSEHSRRKLALHSYAAHRRRLAHNSAP